MNTTNIEIDGSKAHLATTVHHPARLTGKLAILCPGYLDSKDYHHLVGLADVLSQQGYTAVRFDPTGTWESGGEIADYTTTQYLTDIASVLEYMLQSGHNNDILLGGHSRGGVMSILTAAREARITQVLAIMPPASNSVTSKKRNVWQRAGWRVSQRDLPNHPTQHRSYRVPYSSLLDADRYDVLAAVQEAHIPILFVAGEEDDLVPPAEVHKLFTAASEPKRFLIIPGLDHDYRHNDDQVALVNQKIVKQLERLTKS